MRRAPIRWTSYSPRNRSCSETPFADFCEREITREYVRECDREHRPPTELYRKLGEQGWLGINIPEEYGGSGGGAVEVAILLEELGRAFLDLSFWVFRAVTWGGLTIGTFGTEQQKHDLLPKVASGELSVCFSLTEPEAGSDAASISLTATEDGDDYVLNGQKVFTSGFKVSDLDVVATRTSSEGKKHHGITNFLVDTASPGPRVAADRDARPLASWDRHALLRRRAGPEVEHARHAARWVERPRSRTSIRATVPVRCPNRRSQGCTGRLTRLRPGAQAVRPADRQVPGRRPPIGRDADDDRDLRDARVPLCRPARPWRHHLRDAAILKLYACEAYKSVADMGLQVLGGYGYTMEYDLQRHYRESRLGVIGAGTSDIQRNIIARTMGL